MKRVKKVDAKPLILPMQFQISGSHYAARNQIFKR